jgi:hypothetical protein
MTRPRPASRAAAPGSSAAAADELVVEVCPSLSRVAAAQWDRLLEPDDRPLLSWAYLQGLEETGCVGEGTGWLPAHFLVRRRARGRSDAGGAGELVAAAPVYVKAHSEAEWVYDYDWAEFSAGRGIAYYPKLVAAVPFNPVTGGRLLARVDLAPAERQALRRVLLEAMKKLCQRAGLSSAHVLFPRGAGFRRDPLPAEIAGEAAAGHGNVRVQVSDRPAADLETDVMAEAGFVLRRQEQYHFLNEGYRDFDGFLARMSAHRRSTIRRERRALREAGITVRTHRGLAPDPDPDQDRDQHQHQQGPAAGAASPAAPSATDRLEAAPPFSRAELDQVFDLYVGTSQRYTGEAPFLNRAFFHLCADRLGDRLELVLARDRSGRLVGGAFNLRGDRRVFGRYWGAAEPIIPFLHFEVCFYHPVERTIREGLDAFEPGHGGEQKLLRGFTPVYTYSAHYLRDPQLRRAITAFLRYEAPLVEKSLAQAATRCPIRKPAEGGPAATAPDPGRSVPGEPEGSGTDGTDGE